METNSCVSCNLKNLTSNKYFHFFLVDEIQVASYKILSALYTLGTDLTLAHDRKYLRTEFERNKPALGSCLGAFSSTFPVAFLEPHSNKNNQYSLLNRIADHSLEAQDIMAKMEVSMPTLETIMQEVEHYVESEKVIQACLSNQLRINNYNNFRVIKKRNTSLMLSCHFCALIYHSGGHKVLTMSVQLQATTLQWSQQIT